MLIFPVRLHWTRVIRRRVIRHFSASAVSRGHVTLPHQIARGGRRHTRPPPHCAAVHTAGPDRKSQSVEDPWQIRTPDLRIRGRSVFRTCGGSGMWRFYWSAPDLPPKTVNEARKSKRDRQSSSAVVRSHNRDIPGLGYFFVAFDGVSVHNDFISLWNSWMIFIINNISFLCCLKIINGIKKN